jgi:hypothetical protein
MTHEPCGKRGDLLERVGLDEQMRCTRYDLQLRLDPEAADRAK